MVIPLSVNPEEFKCYVVHDKEDLSKYRILHRGWGNGYVAVPYGHKYWGENYNNIPVNVHGGLTYGEYVLIRKYWQPYAHYSEYIVGFDTAHYQDDIQNWPQWRVEKETINLMHQLMQL